MPWGRKLGLAWESSGILWVVHFFSSVNSCWATVLADYSSGLQGFGFALFISWVATKIIDGEGT